MSANALPMKIPSETENCRPAKELEGSMLRSVEAVYNCPRCRANQITFDVHSIHKVGVAYRWQKIYEASAVCRKCSLMSILVLKSSEVDSEDEDEAVSGGVPVCLNHVMKVDGHVSCKDAAGISPPEHLPEQVKAAFQEGATCLAVGCINAAGTMFRLCVDFVATDLVNANRDKQPDARTKRSLGLLLQWLYDENRISPELHELSACIKDDGNDGAHRGTLSQADADDLLDFTIELLESHYTRKARLQGAAERRAARHQQA
ncbi:TPA: DUF4145 domain-containing protein [Stenotrophomonas maltophilia]|uniref:DUF4145 domain-containing protein n=1 Tax=Stenotrophomonas maltophilia TaxID=40324 RepID=UPI000C150C66|nr:DUF4145 domain-containing protein [Stenotrophomonas maltophilia]EKT2103887.1 DUF4145 domain-containing protein [Stenotrophomonas maltophilia]MBH1413987.1 DUF4145 domain-containing protein [Stenotrophomonas maltophilia]MBH1418338.1 DUF4145 domain-containing protein [Stenotrophomonas maltophilia]MBH1422049.1 DUF4145 domain-containing protein [Stenotrophomonas maltophilia]MBH1684438.1 DUF4145 domain-containing protein [Stenotrophomonas maltophilia]